MTPNPCKSMVFVTGKGGTGKSTVTAALGLAWAQLGKRTLVVETNNHTDLLAIVGARHGGVHEEKEISDGLFHVSIDSDTVLAEYLSDQLPGALANVVRRSRGFLSLAAATPGLRELLTIGKIWEMAQPERRLPGGKPYDTVIVDAPATGHGLAMLSSPDTFARAARGGPVMNQGTMIHESLNDPDQTAIVAVARPDELPVSETLELAVDLGDALPQQSLSRVFLNRSLKRRFSKDELTTLEHASGKGEAPIVAALAYAERFREQQRQAARLRRGLGTGTHVHTLPEMTTLGRDELLQLGRVAQR